MPPTNHPTIAKRLKENHPNLSWSECRDLIRSCRVTINDVVVTDDTFRVDGDAEIVLHSRPQKLKAMPNGTEQTSGTNVELKVYYFDEHLIVAEKPTGIESVPFETKSSSEFQRPSRSPKYFIDICRKWIEQQESRKTPPLKIVHRLDKGTSGVMCFARTVTAERFLGQLFRHHDISRSYIAMCVGRVPSQKISCKLVEDRGDGRRGSTQNMRLGKQATTFVTALEERSIRSGEIFTKIQCRLETGRTHQIRIHLAEAGHPLCGEAVYVSRRAGGPTINDHSRSPRIALHAQELGFRHPTKDMELKWDSPLPLDLASWWNNLTPKC